MNSSLRNRNKVKNTEENKANDEIPPINEHIGDEEHKNTEDDATINCNNNGIAKYTRKYIFLPTFEVIDTLDMLELVIDVIFAFIISLKLQLAGGNLENFLVMYAFIIGIKLILICIKIALMKMSKNMVWVKRIQVLYILFIIASIFGVICIPLRNIPGFQYLLVKN